MCWGVGEHESVHDITSINYGNGYKTVASIANGQPKTVFIILLLFFVGLLFYIFIINIIFFRILIQTADFFRFQMHSQQMPPLN